MPPRTGFAAARLLQKQRPHHLCQNPVTTRPYSSSPSHHPTSSGITTTTTTTTTTHPSSPSSSPTAPFYFETGYATFAKRASRPFPPPFLSLPSGSFSDPLTTHTHTRSIRDRRPSVHGQYLKGLTNGDDAVIVNGGNFIGINDGVGAWATRERGHAALWARLVAHFWAMEVESAMLETAEGESGGKGEGGGMEGGELRPVEYLQRAFEQTKAVTGPPNEIYGTTTACSALLHWRSDDEPVVYATNLGDGAVLVIRPAERRIVFKTVEQWHWFDCPRQLGTNSPDTPKENAVVDVVDVKVGDVVVAVSDGVSDNLWENEVCECVCDAVGRWEEGVEGTENGMVYVATRLMEAARAIAQDPFAESPFMERAVEEGLPMEGGKMDDISVVMGFCRKRKG